MDEDREEEDPRTDVMVDIGEVKALIAEALRAAGWHVENVQHGFNEEAFRRRMDRAHDLASILADMLRPPRAPESEIAF